jgi:membrane protease YdiL (CAAX protease family)
MAVFAFVHISFRAVKYFTDLGRLDAAAGLNFTPGMVMILFTMGVLLLCRRSFPQYGLTLTRWRESLRLGLLWGLLLIGGAGLLALFRIRHQAGGPPPRVPEGIAYGLGCLPAVLLFAWLVRRQWMFLNRVPIWLCVALFASLFFLPLLLAWHYGRPVWHALLTVTWPVIGAGIGEEVFYRGYIQSRVNEAFGRPFCFWGVQYGAGLLVSSVLFGFLHALNSVDYFHGRFTFAWGFGVAALGTGLLFRCLRESSGSVVAGVVAHSVLDVLARVPALMP